LAVRIANEGFLVDMSDVAEIVPLPNFAPVPWTKPWYRGLANVRGRLIGVVDLQHLATGTPLLPDQTQQVLVLSQVLQVNVGLLITRAFGIRNLKDIEPLAAVSAASQPWLGQHYRDLDGSTLIELNLRDLLAVAEFSVIGV
jgi:twitching motility protein PilI